MFKVDSNVGDSARHGNTGASEQLELPRLRGRMINLEDTNISEGIAVSEGVQPSAEQDVLRYSVLDAAGERVFCIPRTGDEKRAKDLGGDTLRSAKLLSMRPQNPCGERIFEDERVVDGLVRGAAESDAESSARWASSFHTEESISGARPHMRMSAGKIAREIKQRLARAFRVITGTESLAHEEDRRSLVARLARVPEESVAIKLDYDDMSAAELLDHLEERLLQPYSIVQSKTLVSKDSSLQKRKLRIARMLGRFCDRTQRNDAGEDKLRDGYRQLSEELSAFGL